MLQPEMCLEKKHQYTQKQTIFPRIKTHEN